MFSDENPVFEILEIIKERRNEHCFATKKRNISVLSCRTDGCGIFTFNSREITADTGDILFIPKKIRYSQKTSGETIIAVHLRIYSHISSEMEHIDVRDKEYMISFFEKIYEEWSKKLPGYKQRTTGMVYSLLGDIKAEQSRNKNEAYSKIVDSVIYMKSHFHIPCLQISEIAEKSNISEIYFRKLWKKYYDITPAQYITRLRIDYAKALLSGSDYTISEISEQLGFSDVKYFSTKFKNVTGCTPSGYRKKSNM